MLYYSKQCKRGLLSYSSLITKPKSGDYDELPSMSSLEIIPFVRVY